jgi:uncharacterized protein with NRDE domain
MLPPFLRRDVPAIGPADEKSGGTWLVTSQLGYTLNLMNGGFEKHERRPWYRHSRGWVVLDFLKHGSVEAFLDGYDFKDLEPFTLVVVRHHPREVHSIVWDGYEVWHLQHDASEPKIWSSSTLYNLAQRQQREAWFQAHLAEAEAKVESREDLAPCDEEIALHDPLQMLLDFHQTGGGEEADPATRILMERQQGPRTIAHVGVHYCGQAWRMYYHDLLSATEQRIALMG